MTGGLRGAKDQRFATNRSCRSHTLPFSECSKQFPCCKMRVMVVIYETRSIKMLNKAHENPNSDNIAKISIVYLCALLGKHS